MLRRRLLFFALLSLLFSVASSAAPEITWDRDVYNPKPRPDDVLLPLPCGGAMAFRWVEANGKVPAGVGDGLASLYRVAGPFTRDGSRYLLVGKYEVTELQYQALIALAID